VQNLSHHWNITHRRATAADSCQAPPFIEQLFKAHLSKADLDAIRDTLHKGWALGDNRFRAKIENLSGRRATPCRKAGRGCEDNRV
jgi:putative transposase